MSVVKVKICFGSEISLTDFLTFGKKDVILTLQHKINFSQSPFFFGEAFKPKNMATITPKGNPVHTTGELPKTDSQALDFELVKTDLSRVFLRDFKGSRLILNIFPSIDTPTCATSVRTFNKNASDLENTKVLCISRDLPFAQARFCGAEGIENVISLSDFETGKFGQDYGLTIADGALKGLHSRAIVIIDQNGKVIYTEQVSEIADEPDYQKALEILK